VPCFCLIGQPIPVFSGLPEAGHFGDRVVKKDPRFPNLFVLEHPLIQHKLSHMRDVETSTRTFRELLREITLLMGYEITRDMPMTTQTINTPLAQMQAPVIAGKKVAIVPVLRAGLGMADGLMELIPSARQGHVGVYRGADNRPVEYYVRLPEVEGRLFIVCDPMLATGNSAVHVVDVLIKNGVAADSIRYLALVAAPEGCAVFQAAHPDVPVYVAALDSHLNEKAYIVPGLGDAGDRIFGTKH
jgi:uracil phosphoribosyltransferase